MKKIMSRILVIFIIIITLFEFVCSNNVSYAALEITDEFINSLTSLMGGIVAYGIWLKRLILLGISTVFNGFMSTSFAACCGVNSGFSVGIATPYAIFFNKYKLFDVNFFDFQKTTENGTIIDIRTGVAEWFYILRNIASAVLLCILIYVGIRMAISTIAEEKAKYKKMFFDWACSLALIYVLQYIIMFTVYSNNAIVKALKEMYKGSDMDMAILQIATQAIMPVGLGSIVATIVYCMIVFQTIAFMISYTQRMLKTGFLILISPLISITYSIDKMGDGKAQALNSWLKEFVYTILIQPFHCIIYMAFVTTAISLLSESTILGSLLSIFTGEFNQLSNGILVILCLKFINDGEKAIRKIFNFQDDGNLTSMAAGAMVGVAALQQAGKIASSASNGINSAKNMYSDLTKNVAKFKNTEIGQKITSGIKDSGIAKGISDFASKNPKIANAAKSSGKWVSSKATGVRDKYRSIKDKYESWSDKKHIAWGDDANDKSKNKYITGAKSWLRKQMPTSHNLRNALPGTLGMMAAAMSYAAGDSGAMEALGIGAKTQETSEKLFSSSLGTMARQNKDASGKWAQSKLDLEKHKRNNDVMKAAQANPKLKKRFDSQEKMQRELSSFMKDQAILAEYKDGSKYKRTSRKHWEQARERMKQRKRDGIYEALSSRAELEGAGGEEYKKQLMAERVKQNSFLSGNDGAYGTAALEQKGNEILELIQQYQDKLNQHTTKDDSKMENRLGENDTATPDKMFDTLKQVIDRSVVYGSGGSFDASEIMQNEMGLHDDGSQEYQEIVRAVLEYREMVTNDNVEGIYGQWEKLNGRRESLDNATFRG